MRRPERRVAVIGAGLGGLAAGLRLAARGAAVTVLEQNGRPGGKMNLWERDGYRADTGPSLLTLPWVIEELFADLGLRMEDRLEWIPVRPLAGYVFDDGLSFEHGTRMPEWLETVRRLEGGTAEGYLRLLALGARLFALSRGTFLRRAPFERPDPRGLRCALRYPPPPAALSTYRREVRRRLSSPALRNLFERYPTYVGSSPAATPAMMLLIPYLETAYGGFHIRGGLYRLVEELVAAGARLPFELRCGVRAEAILRNGNRVRGVALSNGETLRADAVLMNGDASCAGRLLDPGRADPLPEPDRSLSGLVFLFALRGPLPGRPHHQVFFSADYDREFRQLFEERAFPDDPTVYVNLPTRSDPSMAPPGGEVMFVMANAPANDGDAWDAAAVAAARGRVLARLYRGGFPDVEHRIAASEVWTPRRFAERYSLPGGALYGTHSHGARSAFLRPPLRSRSVRGLFFVGGSTHPGGGVPTVLTSARIVARLVEEAVSA